ncbi:MAG: aromatic ring-hydroxylating dioxygenase subunit alpha [Parvibaculaceae bacterium]|nr:aromatic ring-hydroxylating dioxygenase subunit alpha [Parvibaculaceae bacterium]
MNMMANGSTKLGDEVQLDDLLGAVKAGAHQDLEHSETLPPMAYVSEDFFNMEVERVFKPGWVCVGHVSQVPEEGSYFTLDLFGEMLVIVRAADGIRAMSRICLHRWAPIAEGCGKTKLFSCPFHKWGFALDGRLLGAPLMEGVQFDVEGRQLPQVRTEVLEGFIFVNFSGDAAPVGQAFTGFAERIGKFKIGELVLAGELSYECDFNWKIMMETFMECYHHIAAHPSTFEASFPARLSYIEDDRKTWTMGASPARDSVPDDKIRVGLPLLSDDLTTEESRAFFLYQAFPSHLVSIWPDRVYMFRCQPRSAGRTSLQTYVFVRPEARELPNFAEIMKQEMDFFVTVNAEDIAVNEMQQKGAATSTAQVGRLSHLEKAVWQLADYIRDRMDA